MPDKQDQSSFSARVLLSLLPDLARNRLSWAGGILSIVAFSNIVFLYLIGFFSRSSSPYLGIFTWVIFPAFLALGILLQFLGILLEHRRRRISGEIPTEPFPRLDFNRPDLRKKFAAFLVAALFFGILSAVGSYQAYQFSDTVSFCGTTCHEPMHPEYTAYLSSPRARVGCVVCHVGPGAGWYVRSKLSGTYQIYSAVFHKYPRPITTPVHNLRPAAETCEECHWPERFIGAQLKVFTHYSTDENNTPRQIRMLIKTGGGSTASALSAGIHWHMNIANRITYVATDPQRQSIPWVRVEDNAGHVTDYMAKSSSLTPQQIAAMPRRQMDCIDCHNRPSHIYRPPDLSVDLALLGGQIDRTLPGIKNIATNALTATYSTTPDALRGIARDIQDAYKAKFPQVAIDRKASIDQAVAATQAIYQNTIFPEMKVDWRTHPNNIGHFYSLGCFRCHDGEHVSSDGRVVRKDCDICHAVLEQQQGSSNPITLKGPDFKHPIDIGDLKAATCTDCHNGTAQ
ncbi:MAG: NapC/NirT family cytochrome c [Acidobacteria bacterium]|nr:NapC/NirT family cytochrome c [Acidobacteriota bacterium]